MIVVVVHDDVIDIANIVLNIVIITTTSKIYATRLNISGRLRNFLSR